jgi:multiple sugar transport system substrate-binding protein
MFLARAVAYAKHPANYSLFFDITTGEPLIDGPGFVRALTEAQASLPQMPPEVLSYSAADCRREIVEGRAAMAIGYETAPAAMPKSEIGQVQRPESMVIGCCRLPGSREVHNLVTSKWENRDEANTVTLAGFDGLCAGVSSHSSQAEQAAAWNFLATLAHDVNALPGGSKSPCREEHLTDPVPWVGAELSIAEGFEYLEAVAESLRDQDVVAELPVPARERFKGALAGGITRAFRSEETPEKALAGVAAEWKTLTEEAGQPGFTDLYRKALGLSAR